MDSEEPLELCEHPGWPVEPRSPPCRPAVRSPPGWLAVPARVQRLPTPRVGEIASASRTGDPGARTEPTDDGQQLRARHQDRTAVSTDGSDIPTPNASYVKLTMILFQMAGRGLPSALPMYRRH